jgi:hypothetical protein
MKNDKFLESMKDLKMDQEVLVRYFSYDIKEYIDILGRLSILMNLPIRLLQMGEGMYYKNHFKGDYTFTLEYIETYGTHAGFTGDNVPKLGIFTNNGKTYCNVCSSNVVFVKPISLRAYKIQKLKKVSSH